MNNTGGTTPIDTTLRTNVARGSGGVDSTGVYYWQLEDYSQPYEFAFDTPKVGDKFWIYTQFGIVRAKVHTVQHGMVLVKIKLPEKERTNGIKWVAYDKPLTPSECFETKYDIIENVIATLLYEDR